MKYLKLFEEIVGSFSPSQVADQIEKAVSGLGTDETLLLSAIQLIELKDQFDAVNAELSRNPKYTYKSLEEVIDGELGWFDSSIKDQIIKHISTISTKQSSENPFISKDPIILSIVDRVTLHEGYKTQVYNDSLGIPTVGVGFNLTRKDAPQLLKKIGANIEKIKSGSSKLTDAQVKMLLHHNLTQAKSDCLKIIENFKSLPEPVQGVLVEMSFALGINRFLGFKRFLLNIENRKFKTAASELLGSKWATQVGNRAKTLAKILQDSANR